ncbi:MAG TPA: hypothetical protein VMV69_10565 [Pirellulales bacterium]|nr:hypothetical protein [Pirellulales bacterium]
MRQLRGLCLLVVSLTSPGCAQWQMTSPPLANPVFVPIPDRDYVWDGLVDVVDDYFKIKREDRVRLVDGVLTQGLIETVPDSSSTLLEPWRMDTVTFYDKLEATFQSMRKYAVVRVMPSEGGFLVEVVVFSELEDVPQPLFATAGKATLRYDTSQQHTKVLVQQQTPAKGWIPMGRDPALEQRILHQVQAKLGAGPPFWQTLPPFCYLPQFQNSGRLAARPTEKQ